MTKIEPKVQLPSIGFGTVHLDGAAGVEAMTSAIKTGYRLIDTAYNYENEGAVGVALRKSGVPRDELIVTSKLPGRFHKFELGRPRIEESLYRLSLDYLDLLLIHWPNPSQDLYVEAWQALIDARDRGLVRHIGVSNFLPEHMERLEKETGELPAVNQVELHPYFPQVELVEWHDAHGIITEAWSPLSNGRGLVEEPLLAEIGQNHGVGGGEVALAWHHARGIVPIPRSTKPERQKSNLDAVNIELSAEEIESITALGRPNGRIKDQDPAVYEEF
ncbi:MAG: aldo/keto reductase [Corynebacterium casei]|nr:aldo/keto reductase [Corynebacterium casei]MDN5707249.1 aldo/keto reductase [Corynebacterium casei]MDN5728332.1 aldo/keto reductase [Corynebacterium casei]MDN5785196.1 aldo/keto reductase [Corynebacterium casei]MDN5826309.1 aldo/keto reductase [Corynebacterium casei]MDN5902562.1 aldo/keto reductase [Corynebacterium casei]